MLEPLVSVVIPAYCHEEYIDSCLDSICKQTYQNIELIVIDDCSNDKTFLKIKKREVELKARFIRVICLQNETNLGVVKTENKLVKLCQGKYIKSIASDDMLLEDAIENLVFYYEQHSEYDIIFSNAIYCAENEKFPIYNISSHRVAYVREPLIEGNIMQALYETDFIQAPTVLFKKETFQNYGLYDESLTIEDWEYWLRIAEKGRIGYCNVITVGYRITGQSLSHFSPDDSGRKRLEDMYHNQFLILERYRNSDKVTPRIAYQYFYQRMLQEAIDIDDYSLQKEIVNAIKCNKIHINAETKIKYLCYRMRLLRVIQKIKRCLGLQTVDAYKLK